MMVERRGRPATLTPELVVAHLLLAMRDGRMNRDASRDALRARWRGKGARPITRAEQAWLAWLIRRNHRAVLDWLETLQRRLGIEFIDLAIAIHELGPAASFNVYARGAAEHRHKRLRGPTSGQRERERRADVMRRRIRELLAQGVPLHDGRRGDGAYTIAGAEQGSKGRALSARQVERLCALGGPLFRECFDDSTAPPRMWRLGKWVTLAHPPPPPEWPEAATHPLASELARLLTR